MTSLLASWICKCQRWTGNEAALLFIYAELRRFICFFVYYMFGKHSVVYSTIAGLRQHDKFVTLRRRLIVRLPLGKHLPMHFIMWYVGILLY